MSERYFERRQIREAIAWAEEGGVAVHRNFDHYHGARSARGFVMTRPFLHVIGQRQVLEEWARANGMPMLAIQPEKRRAVAHIDVFGDFALKLLTRLDPVASAAISFRLFKWHRSPLYARLSEAIVDDPELLALAALGPVGQSPPLLFFGAVHHLLLQGVGHPLARLYPSLNGGRAVGEDPYPAFRDFCLRYSDRIATTVRQRVVQTNDVGRSSILQPGFAVISRLAGKPLALLEIGASAGLNLVGDRYRYSYDGALVGDPTSEVLIECGLRGGLRPPLGIAPVDWRLGIDRDPINICDPEQVLWLRALVWPDQPRRAALLLAAVRISEADPPPLRRGDAVDLLEGAAAEAPRESALCVYSSFTLYQFQPIERQRLDASVTRLARSRPVYRVAFESSGEDRPQLELEAHESGGVRTIRLAAADGHGAWVEWLDANSASV